MMPSKVEKAYRAQVAALPIRRTADGLEVLLITSRETHRWIIPKGWPMKGRKDHQAAAQEALEEAGVTGKVRKHPIGAFTYQKRLKSKVEACRVMVYLLEVDRQLSAFREEGQRRWQWVKIHEAVVLVSDRSLASIILRLAQAKPALSSLAL